MPDESDHFKGTGWTRKRAEGWERAFGSKGDLSNFRRLMEDYYRSEAPCSHMWIRTGEVGPSRCVDCGAVVVMPDVDPA